MAQFIYTGKNAALTSAASFTLAILLHLSLLYEEKNVPYVYVLSKMALELSCK
jgi:ribosomal protein L7Ae-like RNA K-turn-binding protein